MARDTKYGKVTFEHGSIGADEPVFIFRAQDELLPEVIAHYMQLCMKNDTPIHHLETILESYGTVREWQDTHITRLPNSDEHIHRKQEGH